MADSEALSIAASATKPGSSNRPRRTRSFIDRLAGSWDPQAHGNNIDFRIVIWAGNYGHTFIYGI
eukprot:12353708-Heterocapsa_arctica.AAC.1